MPTVQFTKNLLRFVPGLAPTQVEGETVRAVLDALELRHPGLRAYLVDDQGALREHVNIFVGEQLIRDRAAQSDPVVSSDQITIMQALSGG